MAQKIITTVGTSIFENYNESKKGKDSRFNANYLKLKKESYPFSEWKKHKSRRDNLSEIIKSSFNKNNNSASAEIASILAIAGNETDVEVHLIATDTVLSVLAAELIQKWFNESEYDITVLFEKPDKLVEEVKCNYIIQNLSVSSNDKFQEGFMNLIDVVSGLIDESKKAKEEVILNITGGYKAIIPIMTLIGQIKEVPLKYIYEESSFDEKDGLVEVGNLPISFDFSIFESYYAAFEEVKPSKNQENLPNLSDFISKYFIEKESRLAFQEAFGDKGWEEVYYEQYLERFESVRNFKVLIDEEKLLKCVKVNDKNKVSLSILGKLLYDKYDNLRRNGRLGSVNVISNIIELKVFQYYVSKFEDNPNIIVEQGHSEYKDPSKSTAYDIDVHITKYSNDGTVEALTAIEVKPAGAYFDELEAKFKSGSFKYIIDTQKCSKINFIILGYSTYKNPILDEFVDKICKMFQKLSYQTNSEVTLQMNWLQLNENFRTSHNWRITDEHIRNEVEIIIPNDKS